MADVNQLENGPVCCCCIPRYIGVHLLGIICIGSFISEFFIANINIIHLLCSGAVFLAYLIMFITEYLDHHDGGICKPPPENRSHTCLYFAVFTRAAFFLTYTFATLLDLVNHFFFAPLDQGGYSREEMASSACSD